MLGFNRDEWLVMIAIAAAAALIIISIVALSKA